MAAWLKANDKNNEISEEGRGADQAIKTERLPGLLGDKDKVAAGGVVAELAEARLNF